jgi:hypothetical protein
MAFRSPRADAVFAILLAAVIFVVILLWMYYPTLPSSIFGWVLLFVIGIPTWFLLEWLGQRSLEARFLSHMKRATRIALAVPVLILFIILAAYIIHLGQRAIAGA